MIRYLLFTACALCSTASAEFPLNAERAMIGDPWQFEASAWIQRDWTRPKRSSHTQVEVTVRGKIEIESSLARFSALSEETGVARPRRSESHWILTE